MESTSTQPTCRGVAGSIEDYDVLTLDDRIVVRAESGVIADQTVPGLAGFVARTPAVPEKGC